MTNRKNYNSILFLTVYLGLVLVGGNAQVFAHAATNALFDIRNEIEFKEDFDNKPDGCEEIEKSATEKLQSLATLRKDKDIFFDYSLSLKNLLFLGHKNNINNFSLKVEDSDYELFDVSYPKPILFQKNVRKDIETNLRKLVEIFAIGRFSSQEGIDLELNSNKNHSKLAISFARTNEIAALKYASAYNANLDFHLCKSQNFPEKVIYENTKVSSSNNQIFIVTRLPRGSIDSLLK